MKKILFIIFAVLSLNTLAQQKIIPVIVDGDEVTYLKEQEKVSARGNVVMKYKDVVLKCDEAIYSVKSNTAIVKGNVEIKTEKGVIKADSADYDFENKKANIHHIRIQSPPLYGGADSAKKVSEEEYVLNKGYITTCNLKKPHYMLTSKRIIVYPGKKVVAKNVLLKIGNTPVFYIPYYVHSLKDKSFPVEVTPGKDKDWGFYFLTRWRYYFNDDNRGKFHLDWYDKRGVGTGTSHKFYTKKYGEGTVNLYYIDDKLYNDTTDPIHSSNRYKAQLSYHNNIGGKLNLTGEYNKFSDIDFMKDFFYREYEKETHPLSYFLIDYAFSNSSLSLLTQKRVNNFFEETEYLPKLDYNFYRQSIGNTPFYFESDTSLSNLTKKFANSATDYDTVRFHTHNIFSYETKIAWLQVVPYIGLYSTFYSKGAFGEENLWREAPQAGVSFSTKLYKIFDVNSWLLGERIDKIRHIITPTLTYSYIHPPTVSKNNLFEFDEVDTLERKDSLIFKWENKFQAKNKDRIWDLFYFAPSLEYKFNEENKGSFLDNLKLDLEFYPKNGVSFTADSEYDFVDRAFKEANFDLGFSDTKNKKYSVYLGQRYNRNEDSQTTLSFTYQLTPKWQFRNYLRYVFNNGGSFQEQQYVLRRDLHCWWMDIGLDVDENSNYTVWIMFRIKAFPQVRIGFDHTYHGSRSSY